MSGHSSSHSDCNEMKFLNFQLKAELPLGWFVLLILKTTCVLFLKVSEVASEDHGRWNTTHRQSHPRGFWELHLHTNQRPADTTHRLCQPHGDAYVSVFGLQSSPHETSAARCINLC